MPWQPMKRRLNNTSKRTWSSIYLQGYFTDIELQSSLLILIFILSYFLLLKRVPMRSQRSFGALGIVSQRTLFEVGMAIYWQKPDVADIWDRFGKAESPVNECEIWIQYRRVIQRKLKQPKDKGGLKYCS